MLRDSHSLSIERRPQFPSIMINFNLREVAPGEAIRADDWNALVGLLRDLTDESNARELSVGDGLELHKSSSGSTLLLDVGDFREEPETTEYEHPFKVTAGFKDDMLRIHIAPGQWCRLLSPTTINYLNNGVFAADFTLTKSDLNNSTSVDACLFIPAIKSDLLPGHFEPGEPISSLDIYKYDLQFSVLASGVWTINLAKILIDWNEAKASVIQYWHSDLLPLWIHPEHLPVTRGD